MPNTLSLCGRGGSNSHAPCGAPDPKRGATSEQAPNEGLKDSEAVRAIAPYCTGTQTADDFSDNTAQNFWGAP